jgi:cellulose synthase/poly-beta-1,6-N-acetylglucosamine synthase-like glycosyltransferase
LIELITISVFVLGVFFIAHSYIIYPLLLKLISKKSKENELFFEQQGLPQVVVLMAAYNEQKVIAQKMESIINSEYPEGKIQLWIGSDNSTDNTNSIVQEYAEKYSWIKFSPFYERNGKTGIINFLNQNIDEVFSASEKEQLILVLTDANVIFDKYCIQHLAKQFKNANVGQAGANILNVEVKNDGISEQERSYVQRENEIKFHEGKFGKMQGAFGGCYAIRAALLPQVPSNFLMEDFYISMSVLSKRKDAIFIKEAVCYEDVSNEVIEEFKRKTRISTGNFQNLSRYWPLLFRFDLNAFFFFSHKVLRWITPLLMLVCLVTSALLLHLTLFRWLFAAQLLLMIFPLIDLLLKGLNIHIRWLRLIAYFYSMNIALVYGFYKYIIGVKTSAWTPTKRNL